MSQGLWTQLCLLFLPAGVLNTPLPQPRLTWEVGSSQTGGWTVGWNRQGEGDQQEGTEGVERNLVREKE